MYKDRYINAYWYKICKFYWYDKKKVKDEEKYAEIDK